MLNLSKYLSLKRFKFCASYENKTRFMEIAFYSRGLFPFEKVYADECSIQDIKVIKVRLTLTSREQILRGTPTECLTLQ